MQSNQRNTDNNKAEIIKYITQDEAFFDASMIGLFFSLMASLFWDRKSNNNIIKREIIDKIKIIILLSKSKPK